MRDGERGLSKHLKSAWHRCIRCLRTIAYGSCERRKRNPNPFCVVPPPPDVGGRAGNHGGRAENLMIGSSPIHTGARLPHLEEMQGTVAVKPYLQREKKKVAVPVYLLVSTPSSTSTFMLHAFRRRIKVVRCTLAQAQYAASPGKKYI